MSKPIYLDKSYSVDERAKDLVSRMTLDEKFSQTVYNAPAIERLGLSSYNWWSEALHGVARAGVATMFPQAIGLAATYDSELLNTVGDVIGTEARAKHHAAKRHGDTGIYKGLTLWNPNINIFRDPRWGRGQETFGEDPYLTAEIGISIVKGMQGDDPRYLKSAACAKHYAVHSGPEGERHTFDAVISDKDLYETYLYAFERLVKEAKVASVMGAYNRVNGEPCNGSKRLIQDILRKDWGFDGYFLSDCWALYDFHLKHMVTNTITESASMALKAGCQLNCGSVYIYLKNAYEEGLIDEADVDSAVLDLMKMRIRLGMLDDEKDVPYASIPYEKNDCAEHKAVNMKAVRESMVLLHNNGTLPLDKKKVKKIAVLGNNAYSVESLVGNYHGDASRYITLLEGIEDYMGDDARVFYSQGCHMYRDMIDTICQFTNETHERISDALSAAEASDVVILGLGLDEFFEGEETDQSNASQTFANGDRDDVVLPESQLVLLREVLKLGKPTIVVMFSGSAVSLGDCNGKPDAVIQAWYPGSLGGKALAEMIFGEYSPSGKLPVTIYESAKDLPDFTDYSMDNRTYRYFGGKALYPFGYGLSYTKFEYSDMKLSSTEVTAGENIQVTVTVKNVGKMDSDEVVTCYIKDHEASVKIPKWSLCGFKRMSLRSGESQTLTITVNSERMAVYNDKGERVVEPGKFTVFAGGCQPDEHSQELSGSKVLSAEFSVK